MRKSIWKMTVCLLAVVAVGGLLCLCGCGEGDAPVQDNVPSVFTVQYEYNGVQSMQVERGALYNLTEIPVKQGYVFDGLYDSPAGGVQYVNANGMSLRGFDAGISMTLYVHFVPQTYALRLEACGGTIDGETDGYTAAYGQPIGQLPSAEQVTLAHYDFAGWYTQPNGGGRQMADANGNLVGNTAVTEQNFDLTQHEIVLYACYTKSKVPVYLHVDESQPQGIMYEVEYGADVGQLTYATDNRTVITWSTVPNDTDKSHYFAGAIESPLHLYPAEWGVQINFDTQGGPAIEPVLVVIGSTITLPVAVRYSKDEFVGWQYHDEIVTDTLAVPDRSVTLVAQYHSVPLWVTFDTTLADTAVEAVQAYVGDTIALPTALTNGLPYDTLAGWQYGDTVYNDTMVVPDSDAVQLRAVWDSAGWGYIRDAADLKAIENDLNGKYCLLADIDLSNGEWLGIGRDLNGSCRAFGGTFDGMSHTIKGLNFVSQFKKQNDSGYWGLFAKCEGATIKNVTVLSACVNFKGDGKGTYKAGLLVGLARDCTFENIRTFGQLIAACDGCGGQDFGPAMEGGVVSLGGVCGQADDCRFDHCQNYAKVVSCKGMALSGGIAGSGKYSSFVSCQNVGDVRAHGMMPFGGARAGGICGLNVDSTCVCLGCTNQGGLDTAGTLCSCSEGDDFGHMGSGGFLD